MNALPNEPVPPVTSTTLPWMSGLAMSACYALAWPYRRWGRRYAVAIVPIPYGRQTIEPDDVEAVLGVLGGDWLTQGPAVRAFEESVMEACEVPYAVAYSSGTAALHGAAFAAGLGPGDELVTSAI